MRSARLGVTVFVIAILAVAVVPNIAAAASRRTPNADAPALTLPVTSSAPTPCLQSVRCVGGGALLPAGAPFTVVLWLVGVTAGAAFLVARQLRRRPRSALALPRGAPVRVARPPQLAASPL